MYLLVGLLAVGFVCNLAVRPVRDSLFAAVAAPAGGAVPVVSVIAATEPSGQWGLVAIAWTLVGLPLGWGVLKTLTLASQMFR
jgi:hypothetical protein